MLPHTLPLCYVGGMHGGHYTALSRVEEVAAQDLASLRAYAQTHALAPSSSSSSAGGSSGGGGGGAGEGGGVGAAPLTLQEFISTHFSGGPGTCLLPYGISG
jgi:hypothetical protein